MTEEVYSPGLEAVIAGETAISTLAGGLHYRGYSIEALAEHSTFEEVAWLLLHGELPNRNDLRAFQERLTQFSTLPADLLNVVRLIPAETPLMDVLRTAASLLAHWDPDIRDNSPAANVRKAERLLAGLPTVLAAKQRLNLGKEPIAPDPERSLAGNFLWMLWRSEPAPEAVRALDSSLVLYAEHEFNASTFASRVVVSTLSDLHCGVVAAIGALKGPLHGGANERVLEVLESVGSPDKAEEWVRAALARKERIMGFGHRVYRQGDPRAAWLKVRCQDLARATGHESLEATAEVIERVVKAEKGLPPNLDWPSARLYHYLKLPIPLYTPLFVLSRVSGWSAHISEQLANNRLMRPRSRYTGPAERPYVPLDDRN